jgi:GNAT superfamily N-acetyltransferase
MAKKAELLAPMLEKPDHAAVVGFKTHRRPTRISLACPSRTDRRARTLAVRPVIDMSCQIRPVRSAHGITVVRDLIGEYVHWLDIDIAIEGFEAELPHFPGPYSPPAGDLLLAQGNSGEALGCICLRPLELPGACEVKRLYVRPAARGMGLGRALATSAIERASTLGYREVMLDTLPWMTSAIEIYRSLGFVPISPYWNNLVPGIVYLGKTLRPGD